MASSAESRVVVIGAAGIDLVGRLAGSPHLGTSNPANIRFSYGGVARNIAENLAHLGQLVSLVAAVGEDDFGRQLLAHATACGVDVGNCVQVAGAATGSYLAMLEPDGRLHMALDDMSLVSTLTPAFLRGLAQLFAEATLVFFDANLPPASIRSVMSLARRHHVPVGADPTTSSLAKRLTAHLPQLYMITPNAYEATILCQEDPVVVDRQTALQAARKLVNLGTQIVIISMAEFGVTYATSETSGHIPAIRTTVLDPTGAGDAMTAAVLFAMLNNMPIDDAIRLGVSAASLTLRSPGTVDASLSLEKLYAELVI